jgi:protein TonB
MFEESLLESAHLIRTQSRWPAFASFSLQAVIAATIIIIPIIHPEVVPVHAKLSEIAAPPIPTTPPPPPPERVHVDSAASTSAPAPVAAAATHAPVISQNLDPNHSSDTPPALGSMIGMTSNTPSLVPANPSTGGPAIVVAGPVKHVPFSISTGVSAGLLLAPIRPIYPPIAKAAHIEGTVTIHAIISKTGTIESASATTGPMMLQQAALDAVRMARYRPYLLNGLPTEVDTTFVINFRLGS